jgi:dienelactone hydrolase
VFSFLVSYFLASALLAQLPHLSVKQPSGKPIDREIQIQVEQLEPFQEIEIKIQAQDQKGNLWVSQATFHANAQGLVDLTSSCPIQPSSYENIDSMGLFWSMLPVSGDTSTSFQCKDDAVPTEIKLYIADNLVAQETVTRYLKATDVQKIDVRENGLVGALFVPLSEHPLPVIITLSGSNGGLSENRAKLLASNGFSVFALGYFGADGLPTNLQDIPLEYFETAFAWLKEQPKVDASHIGLYRVSRGAELSLILGSFFPDSVQAIVAIVPSSVVYGGLSEIPVNAWIYQDKPILPFAPVPQTDFEKGKGKNPTNTRQIFLEGMKDTAAYTAAAIPVENIRCPVLLVSSGDDQMWPSDLYAQQIIARLEINHSPINCLHLHYPDAGHGINIPNLPIKWDNLVAYSKKLISQCLQKVRLSFRCQKLYADGSFHKAKNYANRLFYTQRNTEERQFLPALKDWVSLPSIG